MNYSCIDILCNKYYKSLGIYFLLVVIIQFIINTTILASKCGGDLKTNIATSAIYTFFPWLLIFGLTMVILIMNPGFKTAFSDVVGYFYISNSANIVLTELLIDKNVQQQMDKSQASALEKEDLENAADAIIKICGNTSILINQIVPTNFNNYWSLLNPLMKSKYQTDNDDSKFKKQQLFDFF
jgi:hypothetical protein